jgi:uncharacterized membrane protein YdjX (TVP38/TMEM64 family)
MRWRRMADEPLTARPFTERFVRRTGRRDLWAEATDFVNNMDARAWRALFVTFALFAVVALMLVLARLFFDDEIERFVRAWFGGAGHARWGIWATILIFTLAAFVAAPQVVLVAACCVAFGPEVGFWFSWAGTVVSGIVTFYVGKFGGASTLRRYRGATGGRFTRFLDKNGFLASFAVRFVPTAPFVVVNMTMGAAGVGLLPYLSGLTLGVLPKIAIVAFAGDVILDALEGKLATAALGGVVAIAIWFGSVLIVRRLFRKE